MPAQWGPPWSALASRALVLSTLILEGVWVYLRHKIHAKGWSRTTEAALEARFVQFAARFVRIATDYRGGLIKLGQVASLRVDVVPETITNELIKLQDRVPAHPYSHIERQVERELGKTPEELFAKVDRQALAAASLAQVHRVVDEEGRELVIKVLYPGVERSVAVDLAMANLALRIFNPFVAPDLRSVYAQIARSIRGEMDYLEEGRAAERVAANLARETELFSHLRLPYIEWKTTTTRVLTMEYIDGDKINDRTAIESRGLDIEECVAWATRAFLHMMFQDRFFHCDPHPGNLMVDREGRVAIIDFGMHQKIEDHVMDGIRTNVLAAVTRNEDLWIDSMIQVGIIAERDRELARELAKISFDPTYYNLTPKEIANLDFGEYFFKMRKHLSRLESFELPDGMVSFGRAFSLLYGLALELAPGMRPLEVVGPYVLQFLQPQASGDGAGPEES